MKVVLVILLLLCVSGCNNEKENVEIKDSVNEVKVDYIKVLCEDLEIEIMNYENGDTTKEDLVAAIHLAKTDCDEKRPICDTLNKDIKDNISHEELMKYVREIEKSCYAD